MKKIIFLEIFVKSLKDNKKIKLKILSTMQLFQMTRVIISMDYLGDNTSGCNRSRAWNN